MSIHSLVQHSGYRMPETFAHAVDVRAPDRPVQTRVDKAMRALRPRVDGARLTISGDPARPRPLAAASAALFDRAATITGALGIGPLITAAVGGACGRNLTPGVCTLKLDGLGEVGGGVHADDEYAFVSLVPEGAALLAALVADLGGGLV